jgi:hypothetical protein
MTALLQRHSGQFSFRLAKQGERKLIRNPVKHSASAVLRIEGLDSGSSFFRPVYAATHPGLNPGRKKLVRNDVEDKRLFMRGV